MHYLLYYNIFLQPACYAANVVRSCNCDFAAISRCISETMRTSAKVTIELTHDLWNGVTFNVRERP